MSNYQLVSTNRFDTNSDSFGVLTSKPSNLHSLERESHPQDLTVCNSHETNVNNQSVRPLPSIEGIITNSVNSTSYETGKKVTDTAYEYVQSDFKSNTKEKYDCTIPVDTSTINLNWDKNKMLIQPSVSNTSYGLVTHVLEQHFGYKDNEFLDNINLSQSSEFPISNVKSTESLFEEYSVKEYVSDSNSSAESDTEIDPGELNLDENEKPAGGVVKCGECDAYLKSQGYLRLHMRHHTGHYPYVCKFCGESFPSCNLYHEHKSMHDATAPIKSFACNECGKPFNCEKHFKLHRRKHVAPKMFDCFECKQSFATKDRLIKHSKIHFGEISFFCDKCGKLFSNKLKFDEHKLQHGSNSWKCQECDECVFETPQLLEKHILNLHDTINVNNDIMKPVQLVISDNDKRFACEICSMKFPKLSDYYIHRCNHKTEKAFKCKLCEASFYKEFHLFVHSSTHNIESFTCDVCEVSFKTKKALKFHIQKNDHQLPFACCHCDLSFKEEGELHNHMQSHCGEKPFSCDQCQATFRHSSTLKIHQRIHSGDTPFVCTVCGASFIQNHHLKIHLRSHSNNKPYKCSDCDASFTKKDYLFAHRIKHGNEADLISASLLVETNLGSGVSSLRCTYCEMTFSHQSTLAAHIRKHTGERPFVCDSCGASFLYSSNLTTHRRKHTGERPYKCKECDASFTLKSYLTMHLRKHSGERPFKCDICESSFTQKTHLSTHRRIHTGEYPYKCDVCGDAFRDGANFWRHKKKHSYEKQKQSASDGRDISKNKRFRAKNSEKNIITLSSPNFHSGMQVRDKKSEINEGNLPSVMEYRGPLLLKADPCDPSVEVVKSEAYS